MPKHVAGCRQTPQLSTWCRQVAGSPAKPLAAPQQAGAPFTGLPGEEAGSSDAEWTISAQPDSATEGRPSRASKGGDVEHGQKARPGCGQVGDKQQPKAVGAADSGARSTILKSLHGQEVQSSCSATPPAAARAAAGHSTGASTGRQNAGDAGVQTLVHTPEHRLVCLPFCPTVL